ncbi:SAM hydrolase/SAM-dependent halogenase family protein [Catenuloplanes atrovinosus]|uniref:S-adenosylmethionine hydrolase n=1 Tax=Catenuloplanes atrovinosus TaxID=137266 RepID=A0AAE3YJC5_9ACTN|nr:SAM-dependent chlorinase/fluorinase [Catenuloplanes atrovinosus]MDR7273429.1 S-adenosylmethionine hydrolase [Catenuloplanes atrovinosus]
MAGYAWISLTTDYGLSDGFAASCHGVIARIAPAVRVIDITHAVAPGDVPRAASVLAQTAPHLPPAVHVAVAGPGTLRPIGLRTPGGVLIGPDNGVLPWAAEALGGVETAVTLAEVDWFLPSVSGTLPGRDVYSPVAARIAAGAALTDAGPEIPLADVARLPDPVVATGDGWLEAEVTTIDRFGNVQLAAPASAIGTLEGRLIVGGVHAVRGITISDAPRGGLVVYVDSAGRVAVAVNGGRAAVVLSVVPGDLLRVARV